MLLSVKQERSGWRDHALSERHRLWGFNCPATDIDFLEYDRTVPVALIEFKHEFARPYDPSSANIRACRHLADGGRPVPFFVIIRAHDMTWFEINAENHVARRLFGEAGLTGDRYTTTGGEVEMVEFLYWLRKRSPDRAVIDGILANPFSPPAPLALLRKAWAAASAAERGLFLEEIRRA